MTKNIELKIIESTSKLNDLAKGQKILVKGVVEENQKDELLVLMADNNAGLFLGGKYLTETDQVEICSYFITPYGVKKGTIIAKYNKNSNPYDIYKNLEAHNDRKNRKFFQSFVFPIKLQRKSK